MIALSKISTLPPKTETKENCKNALRVFRRRLFELQNVFYADGRFGLLIILEGIDASGKDGTIRHVMTCMNPMGLQVHSFKQPTEEEQKHDFLWRVYPHIPARSMIQVFNRSYYEDIIVPVVDKSISQERVRHRVNFINVLEDHLSKNNIHVLKFFLHISRDEQKKRIKERLTKPHKRWKSDKADQTAAKKWNAYESVYETLLKDCNRNPWHIIPADKRWFRNYSVAKIITAHFEKLNLKYPVK